MVFRGKGGSTTSFFAPPRFGMMYGWQNSPRIYSLNLHSFLGFSFGFYHQSAISTVIINQLYRLYMAISTRNWAVLPDGKPPFSYGFPIFLLESPMGLWGYQDCVEYRSCRAACQLKLGRCRTFEDPALGVVFYGTVYGRTWRKLATVRLVVWNIWIIFPYIGNVIIPTDELIFFRGVGIPPTSYEWTKCHIDIKAYPFMYIHAPIMTYLYCQKKERSWKITG